MNGLDLCLTPPTKATRADTFPLTETHHILREVAAWSGNVLSHRMTLIRWMSA